MSVRRPKGMPRKEFDALTHKQKVALNKKFLNFNIQTSQINHGTQQYGVGQTLGAVPKRSRNVPTSSAAFGNVSMGDNFGTRPGRHMRAGRGAGGNCKRELMATINSSTNFSSTQYRIQPANSAVFPWAADIAAKFQKWRCIRLALEYVPTVESYAVPGRQGRVVLAANYDCLDANLENITQAESISPSAPGKPTDRILLELDPSQVTGPRGATLLVRPGQLPANGTLTAFDGGVFYVATNGFDPSITVPEQIGEVFVIYEFEFYDPIIQGVTMTPQPTHTSVVDAQYDVTLTIPNNTWSILPDMVWKWNGLGITLDSTAGSLTFPPGRYSISGQFVCDVSNTSITEYESHFTVGGLTQDRSLTRTYASGVLTCTVEFFYVFEVSSSTVVIPQVKIVSSGVLTPRATQWPRLLISGLA